MKKDEHRVMLCLASNWQQEHYMEEARRRLEGVLGDLHFTSEHWTEPVGGTRPSLTPPAQEGKMYLNQLATGVTTLEVEELNAMLKEVERQLDRKHDGSGIVTIDIDLLEHDGIRYHLRDWERDYVKELLPEL